MRIVTEPKVYLVGRTQIDGPEVQRFLADETTEWITDGEKGSELLAELAGRVCYLSFGDRQGRKSNRDYLQNIIGMEHGSVLEHAVWNFVVTGVSRSFSHEMIRHRAGWGYCLTGDTLIYSEHMDRGQHNGTKKRTLQRLHEMTQTAHGRSRLKLLRLRCFDERTSTFTTGRVRTIAQSGMQPVFEITLEDGKTITCSAAHRFLTEAGWMALDEIAGGLTVAPGGLALWRQTGLGIMVNGTPAYKDREWLEQRYVKDGMDQKSIAELAGVSRHTIRAWVRKHGLQKPLGSWTVGAEPWNKGKHYRAGWHHSEATKMLFSEQKRGSSNPQWKGGVSRDAVSIRRGVEFLRLDVLARDGYHCRLCGAGGELTMHHVIPIWARRDLASDIDNIVSLCVPCHRAVTGRELEYVERFGRAIPESQAPRNPGGGRTLTARPRKIVAIKYAGVRMTYDIEMDGEHRNFVANGLVTHNSQLSQRYVDESDTDFVEPDIIANNPDLHDIWLQAVRQSHEAYLRLADGLAKQIAGEHPEIKGRDRRIQARQAARSVLPNATETKIFMTANARALRHFVEYRGAPDAEPEIRKVAIAMLEVMQAEAPTLFGDYTIEALPDGSRTASTSHRKV